MANLQEAARRIKARNLFPAGAARFRRRPDNCASDRIIPIPVDEFAAFII
jgi:hypothetical protein